MTIELVHEPGEELQLDWLELPETLWGEPAHVLVGALAHSGRIRAVLSEGEDFAQLVAALDGVLRRLGGTSRSWRTDRMSTIVEPGSGRLRAEAAELAKHYGVTVLVCPPRRAQRKGVVEAAIRYLQRSWWRTADAAMPAHAQASLDRWCIEVADQRRRDGLTVAQRAAAEPLLPLPPVAYPAELQVERVVSASALVAFDGNRYSIPPGLAGQTVSVLTRLGEPTLRVVSAAGVLVATHRRLPTGAGQIVRIGVHRSSRPCSLPSRPGRSARRKPNRPPSVEALTLAAALTPEALVEPELPTLEAYAALAEAR